MLKLYQKEKIWFAVIWIIAYCVLMSVGDALSSLLGVQKCITLAISLIMSVIAIIFLKKNSLFKENGLCKPTTSLAKALFYLPLAVIVSVNVWFGVKLNYGVLECVLSALTMLLVGFLEEIIFRGFLFNALKESSLKVAVIVSSLTFGVGHIINLLSGSADLIPTLLQIGYATAAGFLFVIIFIKTESIMPCVITHSLLNALSVFSNDGAKDLTANIIISAVLVVISILYALHFIFFIKKEERTE